MKQVIFLALLTLSSGMIFAQSNRNSRNVQRNTPPTQVQQSFKRDNPKASDARWMQANNQWHAEYPDKAHDSRNADAYYDKKGKHVDTHIEWDRNQLPKEVDSRIYSKYHTKNYKVYRIERPSSPSLFQIILNIAGGNKTVYVDERGNEVKYKDKH